MERTIHPIYKGPHNSLYKLVHVESTFEKRSNLIPFENFLGRPDVECAPGAPDL